MRASFFIAVSALFTLLSCGKQEVVNPRKVSSIVESVYASGTIVPKNEHAMFSLVNGIVLKKHVKDGDVVKKGQILYEISSDAPSARMNSMRAAYEKSVVDAGNNSSILYDLHSALENAQSKFSLDSALYFKYKKLILADAVSQLQLDQAQVQYGISANAVKSAKEKYDAAIGDIRECYERGQPVLVGTTSIENSELISEMLTKAKLPHQVLNAKQHAREADIIAQAGRPGMITIATNMAGRGTDIVLGGNIEKDIQAVESDESLSQEQRQTQVAAKRTEWLSVHEQVKSLGGLRIIATERHESRRIDNQLRGRSGRQGDPGSSRFYLSLDDPLMRIFAGDRVRAIMDRLKMPEGEAIEAGMVTRSIESAQRKVEARNFDTRKQLLEYDDVSNDQRKVIYQQRNDIIDAKEMPPRTKRALEDLEDNGLATFDMEDEMFEELDFESL